jgi:hypothetical protein
MRLYSKRQEQLSLVGGSTIIRRLTRIWRDLEKEEQWRYRELPPFALFEALELNLLYADESEVARASWFWLRRPKSLLLTLICVCSAPLLLFVPRIGLPLYSAWSLGILVAAIADDVRFMRWRREYELSIDRLIRTLRKAI